MADIVDRLETVTRDFPTALFVGASSFTHLLSQSSGLGDIVCMDLAPNRLKGKSLNVVGDEEEMPFAPESFDLIVSLLTLHTANDLIGALIQARRILKPDGLFLAALFGEGSLATLRGAFLQAEAAAGGAAARFAPFAAIQDFGQALGRAGFAMPVTDSDQVKVSYREPMRIVQDLRAMGETNPLLGKTPPLKRETALNALGVFSQSGGEDCFNIIYLTGWAPAANQPKPLKPGSAKASMAAAIKTFTDYSEER
ncbi:MAG: methyltransferase domain-containing protein [Pseudomonadota bacterium]